MDNEWRHHDTACQQNFKIKSLGALVRDGMFWGMQQQNKLSAGETFELFTADRSIIWSTLVKNVVLIMIQELIMKFWHTTYIINTNLLQEEWAETHAGISEGLQAGWIKPVVGKEYTMEESGLAHEEVINNSGTFGKKVIVMWPFQKMYLKQKFWYKGAARKLFVYYMLGLSNMHLYIHVHYIVQWFSSGKV